MKLRLAPLVVSALAGLVVASVLAAERKPNFLFIYTDDQRWDALSVVQREQGERGRFPWFQTPHMDRLAREGVRFRNAFVVNSLCAPSRAVYLTGRYNHHNGIASNFRPFPTNNVTHATLLRAAGYITGYIGKWHMNSQRERPGFDFHASFIGHARYFDPTFVVQGEDVATKGWIDDLSTDYALEFLRKQKGSGRPWSLVVGFKSPHGPFEPPARATNRFAGALARTVPNLTSPAPYMGETPRANRAGAVLATNVPVNLNYFRCISAVDDCLGRLLDALEELGFAQNTVVTYASDNGFYLGEHGLGDKRSAYDESLRIPLLVRYPTLGETARGKVRNEMVLNLDLAPTMLEFAGVPAPQEMQGRSWRPLLTGAARDWRTSWFYEYFAEKQRNSRVPDITAVRTATAKLIQYPGHEEWSELFDLASDPYETRNLIREAASAPLRARLESELGRLAKGLGYCVPDYVDRPEWWGKPDGPDWKPDASPSLRLHFDFAGLDGDRVMDLSGHGNHGLARQCVLGERRNGRKVLRVQGEGYVEIPKSKSLDPTGSAWTVEAIVKADQPDGVILARGGRSQGYALWLKAGRPVFTVTVGTQAVSVQAQQAVTDWIMLVGMIGADRTLSLHVNGKPAGHARLPDLIERDPNDTMQIGADLGSPVVEPVPPKFNGWIERIRLFSGESKPDVP